MNAFVAQTLGVFVLLAAPFVGSFIATLARRWPEGRSVMRGRSHCPSCRAPLAWHDLIPVISWLALRGRCRRCDARIAGVYPLSELAALAIAVWAATAFAGVELALVCMLGWALLALALIDFRTMLLPDGLNLLVLGLGLAVAAAYGSLLDAVLGAAVGFAVFALVAAGYRAWRGREGLGLGDAKLLAAAGAWVGVAGLPGVVLIAGIAALTVAVPLAWRSRQRAAVAEVAFGPYLAAATWLTVLYGPFSVSLV